MIQVSSIALTPRPILAAITATLAGMNLSTRAATIVPDIEQNVMRFSPAASGPVERHSALLSVDNSGAMGFPAYVGTANPGATASSSTITVTNTAVGSYVPGLLNNITGIPNGMVTIEGFANSDAEIIAVAISVSDSGNAVLHTPSEQEITDIIADLNDGLFLPSGVTAVVEPFNGNVAGTLQYDNPAAYYLLSNTDAADSGQALSLAVLLAGINPINSQTLGFGFGEENVDGITALNVTDIAVVPEPGSFGLLLLGGLPLLGRRWRGRPARSMIEPLEHRTLLSGNDLTVVPTCVMENGLVPALAGTLSPPFAPAQMVGAYGAGNISFNGVTGDGTGQTIAIVDLGNDPNIVPDANYFSFHYGLQQFNEGGGPTLTVLNQDGDPTPLPANAVGYWDVEESLDVEWAHAIAPQANIVLLEANSVSWDDLISTVKTAAALPGVSVVSMSWGADIGGTDIPSCDPDFLTPTGHQGVTFLAASGDAGSSAVLYPAYSPDVLAVGGTTLMINSDGSYIGESGWSGSGGGMSPYESQPAYQSGIVSDVSATQRCIPDVAMDADPNSSFVQIYDTYAGQYSTLPAWSRWGGTSLACPMWAGLIAIANQGRVLHGLGTLNGSTQTLPALYSMSPSFFHDMTTGNNGHAAGPGYDLVTGLGSPIANLLVPALAGYPTGPHLAFGQEPANMVVGSTINPAVTIDLEDANGNIITSDNSEVTLSIWGGPGGATLQGTTTVAAGDGVAAFSDLSLATIGNYTLEATDGTYFAATSNAFSNRIETTTAVTSTGPSTYGQPVTFAATVTPADGSDETGMVQFQADGSSVGGPVALNGNTASCTTCALGGGNRSIVAVYSGDGNFSGSTSSTLTQCVATAPTTVTLTTSNDALIQGQWVLLTATVTPASGSGETGTVQFQVDGGNVGSPVTLSGNTASYRTASLPVGDLSVVAIYSGDGNFSGSTSAALAVDVVPVPTITVTPPGNQTVSAQQADSLLLGSFSQCYATGPFTVTVFWGDGSDSIFSVTAAGTIPATAHTYATIGSKTVSVTVTDSANDGGLATFNVSVVPGWLGANSAATWDAGNQTLTVTGSATVIGDPYNFGDAPNIYDIGNSSYLLVDTQVADGGDGDALVHVAAITGNGTTTVIGNNSLSVGNFSQTNLINNGAIALGGAAAVSGAVSGTGNMTIDTAGDFIANDFSQTNLVNNGAITLDSAAAVSGAVSGPGIMTVAGTGNLTTNGFSQTNLVNNGMAWLNGAGTIGQVTGTGWLVIGNGSSDNTVQLVPAATSDSVTNTQTALTISSGSTLDIANNTLMLNYGNGSSPLASVRAYVASGAIISSTANAGNQGDYGVGYADSTELTSIAGGNVEVMYTLGADANLDGRVNFNDFSLMQNNYDQSGRDWAQADFNHDGNVNFNDFSILQNDYDQNLSAAEEMSQARLRTGAMDDSQASSPTVTYTLSINDDGTGNYCAGHYAVYATDTTDNGGLASFEVNVGGAATINNVAPYAKDTTLTYKDVGFDVNWASTPPEGSQDTTDALKGETTVLLVYGIGQTAGNLGSVLTNAGGATSAKKTVSTQAVYGAPVELVTGTFTSGTPSLTNTANDTGNVFIANGAGTTQAPTIAFHTVSLSPT